jgi:hypothetical protein
MSSTKNIYNIPIPANSAVCKTEMGHAVLRKCNLSLEQCLKELAIEEMPSRIVNGCRVVTLRHCRCAKQKLSVHV